MGRGFLIKYNELTFHDYYFLELTLQRQEDDRIKRELSFFEKKCPECGSNDILFLEDETICNTCKLVLQGTHATSYSNSRKIIYPWGYIF